MKRAWQQILHEFEREIPRQIYEPYIKSLTVRSGNSSKDDKLILQVSDRTLLPFLKSKYKTSIQTKLHSLMGRDVAVEFELHDVDSITDDLAADIPRKQSNENRWLNPDYTFQTFIKSRSNELAHIAAESVVEEPGQTNPLFIYGVNGIGKTHIVHAIAHSILERNPSLVIKYLCMDSFKSDFLQAIKSNSVIEFKNSYKNGNVIIIEDIQLLKSTAESTQEEFFHLYNHYFEAGYQIIITSDIPASRLSLSNRLISRLMSGLLVNIDTTDTELCEKYFIKRNSDLKLGLKKSTVNYLSTLDIKSIREADSIINRLQFYKKNGQNINDLITLKKFYRELKNTAGDVIVSIDTIMKTVSEKFGVSEKDIRGNSRRVEITLPRHVAMYLAVSHTNMNKSAIARYFNRNDHSTVINAEKNIARRRKNSSHFDRFIENLVDKLCITVQ